VDNVSTDRLTVANRKLYHSPKRVEHLSGRPASGQTQQVSFRVYDQNYLFNQEQPTPFPQVVKFEADGQLSSEYGLAAGGTVSVSWTPNDNDILYAKLYDINGNVLAQDTVHAGESSGDWVDLGLPSGLLWATRNVGATSPEDYGDYFAWGETQPKEVYDWSTYIYCNDGNYSPTYYGTLTKYCDYPGCGYYDFTDNLTILQPSDDAATANYGGRMPTQADWQELIDNTTIQLQTQNGVNGIIFTGSNDNSLFLPLAGYHYFDGFLQDGIVGYYWSSSLYTDQMNPYHAWCFSFGLGSRERFIGHSVRAVRQN
jgi:hypothetical protein